jgi:hypothetical protein
MKEIQYLSYLGHISRYRHLKNDEKLWAGEYRVNFRRVHTPTGQNSKFSIAVLKQQDAMKLLNTWNASMPSLWEYSLISIVCI